MGDRRGPGGRGARGAAAELGGSPATPPVPSFAWGGAAPPSRRKPTGEYPAWRAECAVARPPARRCSVHKAPSRRRPEGAAEACAWRASRGPQHPGPAAILAAPDGFGLGWTLACEGWRQSPAGLGGLRGLREAGMLPLSEKQRRCLGVSAGAGGLHPSRAPGCGRGREPGLGSFLVPPLPLPLRLPDGGAHGPRRGPRGPAAHTALPGENLHLRHCFRPAGIPGAHPPPAPRPRPTPRPRHAATPHAPPMSRGPAPTPRGPAPRLHPTSLCVCPEGAGHLQTPTCPLPGQVPLWSDRAVDRLPSVRRKTCTSPPPST